MSDIFAINFIYNFIVNDMLGSLSLFVLLIFMVILGLAFIANMPRFGYMAIAVGLVLTFAQANYVVATWVKFVILIGMAILWAVVLKTGFDR